MAKRSYNQVCGAAQALDLVGERWTLLVVRELLLGPKRFGALLEALPGLGANLLSARLRSLETAGIVERVALPPPAATAAYALTRRGEAVRPVVESLAVWGFDLLDPEPQLARGWLARGSWLAFTLAATQAQQPSDTMAPPMLVNFDIDGDRFFVRHDGERAHVQHGAAEAPDAELRADLVTLDALARGDQTAEDATVAELLETLSQAARGERNTAT